MNLVDFAAAIHARLQTQLPSGITVVDGEPATTPAGNYCFTNFDGGTGRRGSLARTDHLDHQVWVVCVGLDRLGARFVADKVNDALLDYRPDGNHPIGSAITGPSITDGPAGDRRTSITLAFALPTWRS